MKLHVWSKKFHDFLSWWETLEAAGLRPVMMEPNLVYVNYNRQSGAELAEVRSPTLCIRPTACTYLTSLQYTFLNIRGNNIFVSDAEPSAADAADDEHDTQFIRHGPRD